MSHHWELEINGEQTRVSAHWKGILCGKLLVYIDKKLVHTEIKKWRNSSRESLGCVCYKGCKLEFFPIAHQQYDMYIRFGNGPVLKPLEVKNDEGALGKIQ